MKAAERIMLPPDREVHLLDEGVLINTFDGYDVIEGDLAAAILIEAMAGLASREAIAKNLAPKYKESSVDQVVSLMIRDGLLVEFDPDVSENVLLHWLHQPWPVDIIRDRLKAASVFVNSLGPDEAPLLQSLEAYGIQTGTEAAALHIVLAHDLRDERLAAINRFNIKNDCPWILICTHRCRTSITLFVPGRTACWACLRDALEANIPRPLMLNDGRKVSANHPMAMQLPGELSGWVMQWLIEESCEELEAVLHVRHLIHQQKEHHPVRKRSHCSECGTSASANLTRGNVPAWSAVLQERGQRKRSALEAFIYASHLISPMTGVVRQICPLPVVDERMGYLCVAQHRIVRPDLKMVALRQNTQARSIGKGRTLEEARTSALYEGIERYSGVYREDIETHRSIRDALPARSVDPLVLSGFSASQYAHRKSWNYANKHQMLYVPCRFAPSMSIDWVKGWSLTEDAPCFIAAAQAYYDHPDARLGFALADSNGCAAGERRSDAVLTGLFECIERDAVAIWWYNRISRPGVALSSFDHPWIQDQPVAHHDAGRTLWVLDVTTDLETPVMVAISRNNIDPTDWALGFGCHWSVERAVSGALMEVNQVLSIRQHQADSAPVFSDHIEAVHDADWLLSDQAIRKANDYPPDTEKWPQLGALISMLKLKGLEVIVVDQTHPDTGVPVVRVVVPGLAHHWRRLGVDRLYTVPVALGWRKQPCAERMLNPVDIVL